MGDELRPKMPNWVKTFVFIDSFCKVVSMPRKNTMISIGLFQEFFCFLLDEVID